MDDGTEFYETWIMRFLTEPVSRHVRVDLFKNWLADISGLQGPPTIVDRDWLF